MQPWIMIQTGMVTGWEDKMNIREELGKRMLFFDGGLGSLLQARGLKPGELPETWNLSKPEELLAKPYYISCDMSKYIALLIDTLNHDQSISELLNPTERIQNILKKYGQR